MSMLNKNGTAIGTKSGSTYDKMCALLLFMMENNESLN